jgi:hypothetical protein
MDFKGANGTSAPQPFSTLSKYWDYLRLQNLKDMARKENDDETKQKRAYFNILKTPTVKETNLKRSYVNTMTQPNKRSNTQGHYSLDNRQNNMASPSASQYDGKFEDKGAWYSTMTAVPRNSIFPQGYNLPTRMDQKAEVSHRVVEVLKRIFPHVKPGALTAICQTVNQREQRGLSKYCLFHRTDNHGTLSCPCFCSHYWPVKVTGAPTKYIVKSVSWNDVKKSH